MHEPNEKAIVFAMLKAAMHDVECLALLTVDAGFVNTILEVEQSGIRSFVFIPLGKLQISRTYEAAGVHAVILKSQKTAGGKVIATLHDDGSGSVELAPAASSNKLAQHAFTARTDAVIYFLNSLGFEAHGYTIQSIAKFWFTNNLGSLVVYPADSGLAAVHEVISEEPRTSLWTSYYELGKLAFFLPHSAEGKMTKSKIQTYGNSGSHSIFRGGGPFILSDSDQLVEQVLRLFGYLDDEFNADLREAMLCFVNANGNKKKLKRRGMLPAFGETSVDVQSKLRRAFLSHDFSGQWQLMNKKSTEAMKPLQHIMNKAGFLQSTKNTEYCHVEIFEAMHAYMQQEGLPSMNTFNGRAWRILRANRRNPDWTGDVEF